MFILSNKPRIIEKKNDKSTQSKYVETNVTKGLIHSKKGEIELAIADYTKAIELNPDNADAYHHRGNAYRNKGNIDKAIADYTQMIVLRPKIPESYYIRGEAYLCAEKWEEAKRDLTAAILQGVDIREVFLNTHESLDAFEKKTGTKLPEDIIHLLTSDPESFEIEKDERIALV